MLDGTITNYRSHHVTMSEPITKLFNLFDLKSSVAIVIHYTDIHTIVTATRSHSSHRSDVCNFCQLTILMLHSTYVEYY